MSGNGRAPAASNLVDLVIISGQSGAGKSSAMNVFEDAGYFCVDNLPAEMIRSLAELFRHPGSKVAIACDLPAPLKPVMTTKSWIIGSC